MNSVSFFYYFKAKPNRKTNELIFVHKKLTVYIMNNLELTQLLTFIL